MTMSTTKAHRLSALKNAYCCFLQNEYGLNLNIITLIQSENAKRDHSHNLRPFSLNINPPYQAHPHLSAVFHPADLKRSN